MVMAEDEPPTPSALEPIDKQILDVLHEGRNSPSNIADVTDASRQWVHQRLSVLEAAGYVENIGRGVYELRTDPRPPADQPDADGPASPSPQAQAHDPDTVKSAQVFLQRALQELPEDVPGRGAVEDAAATLAEAREE